MDLNPMHAGGLSWDEFDNFKGLNWNFGVLWNINKYLSLGAVLKTSFWGDIDHIFKQSIRDFAGNITSILINDIALQFMFC